MRKEDFHNQLIAASFASLCFGQEYVSNRLSHDLTYVVLLNQSYDGHRKEDEIVFPEDDGKICSDLSQLELVDLLHRDGRCPMWIDIQVAGADKKRTLMSLRCCGRYHDDESRMYYYEQGTQPFGIKSPDLSHAWREKFIHQHTRKVKKFKLKNPSKAIEDIISFQEQNMPKSSPPSSPHSS
ncbi:MAG: hypothetical protein H8E17_00780 [Deltaproteobacteria bacterium]|nr:hypothetical protein [Deltaproteobacteria bacterium]